MPYPPPPGPFPPSQAPITDRHTGRVTTIWHRFFLSLLTNTDLGGVAAALPPASVPIAAIAVLDSPRLLGRGSPGTGPAEPITIGAGLALTGTDLRVVAGGGSGGGIETVGYWTPITDGVTPIPELLCDAAGDCVVGFVPTPS